jgi:P-aminobenzoate N-oxygenase AurF
MTIAATATKLSIISAKMYDSPVDSIQWAETMDRKQWFTSPELISLYGTTLYDSLSETEQQNLSFHEAVNFYSLNINGEKPLVEGLTRRLYQPGNEEIVRYLHHFLDEENKHMQYFGRFCMNYAGKVYPDKKIVFPRTYAKGEEDFLFFAKVMIFEEIADHINVQQAADTRLNAIAREINSLHHRDEARHLIFGRELVAQLFTAGKSHWNAETVAGIQTYLGNYISATWKEYYNPAVYADAGIENAYEAFELAWNSDHSRNNRRAISAKVINYFLNHEIITSEPAL